MNSQPASIYLLNTTNCMSWHYLLDNYPEFASFRDDWNDRDADVKALISLMRHTVNSLKLLVTDNPATDIFRVMVADVEEDIRDIEFDEVEANYDWTNGADSEWYQNPDMSEMDPETWEVILRLRAIEDADGYDGDSEDREYRQYLDSIPF